MKKYLAKLVKKAYQDGDFYDLPYEMRLDDLNGWPRVPEEMFPESLEKVDMENFEWLEISDDKIVICCSGDWQEPMKVVIKLRDNKLFVSESYPMEYEDGLSEDEFNQLLFGTIYYNEILE